MPMWYYMEINKLATDNYLTNYYNNLLGILISK